MWYKWETCLYCESIMELKIVLKGFFSSVYERKILVDILHVPKFSFLTNICFLGLLGVLKNWYFTVNVVRLCSYSVITFIVVLAHVLIKNGECVSACVLGKFLNILIWS